MARLSADDFNRLQVRLICMFLGISEWRRGFMEWQWVCCSLDMWIGYLLFFVVLYWLRDQFVQVFLWRNPSYYSYLRCYFFEEKVISFLPYLRRSLYLCSGLLIFSGCYSWLYWWSECWVQENVDLNAFIL